LVNKRRRADDECQRRPCAGLIVDGRLRQSAGDGITLAQGNREIGGAEPQKFLPHVEVIAVLGRKASCSRDALDIGEQQDAGRQREGIVEFHEPEFWQCKGRQPLRNLAGNRDAKRREPQ
jgi:hypothetical protein